MTTPHKNSLLVFAIVAGLLSLPMIWFTTSMRSFSIHIGPGQMPMTRPHFDPPVVTGFSGNVDFFLTTPLWFVVAISIAASVMQLMTLSSAFAISKWATWLTPIVGIMGSILPLFRGDSYQRTSIGLGWVLGMFCACTPLACLVLTRTPRSERSLRPIPSRPKSPDFELPNEL